jgi:hypothetical protein
MMNRAVRAVPVLLALALLPALPAGAQVSKGNNTSGPTEVKPTPRPPSAATVKYEEKAFCNLNGPQEVQGYHLVCTGATFLDFSIADCCLPGDHWQLKGKAWDVNPNTAVTTAPGGQDVLGVVGRIYNYGGTGNNPGGLDAYVECSYLNGVNVFPAGSTVLFSSDGACTLVSVDPIVPRIDRTP